MDQKEYTNEYEGRYLETEEFLNQYLPSENPTEEEYIHAYEVIEALRESKHPHRAEEHKQLAMDIERGLPYSSKGFNLLLNQVEYEASINMPRTESLVDGIVYLDLESWQNGYAAHRIWRMIMNHEQSEVVERILWKLQMYSFSLYKQTNDEYMEELEKEEKKKRESKNNKQPLPLIPPKIQKKAKGIAEDVFLNLPSATDELKENTERFRRSTIYFESLLNISKNPDDMFKDFGKKSDFWMSKEGEILLSNLLTSKVPEHYSLYYRSIEKLIEDAERKNDITTIGRVGTRHAMRMSRIDPFSRDFTDIEYWSGIKVIKQEEEAETNTLQVPRKYDGRGINGFKILRELLKSEDEKDSRIYKTTMESFIEYVGKNMMGKKGYETIYNFFKTQYSFDLAFNLHETEREIEGDNSFDFVLRKYLWLKYGPEYTGENPTEFEIKLWNLQKNILLKGIRAFEELFNIQRNSGQNEYEIHKDFYQEAKGDLIEQYTESAWHLIMFTTRNFKTEKEIFRRSFSNFQIDLNAEDEKLFYLSVLLGTLDFALTMKHTENLKKVSASSLRYLYGKRAPSAFEDVSEKAEKELERWRFRKDEKDPQNPRLRYDNNIFNSLRNLSIMWGRGYGTSVLIEQEGILVKNPLHTMGEERDTIRNGNRVKERPAGGGRDEVLIPWEIIAKAVPQFNYIPWADSILKLVGQYRANLGRKDLDWISDLTSKGPAVIKFEAAGSERMYELPPLKNAKNIAKLLKEIAAQMVVAEIPNPKDILKKIE